MRHVLRRHKTKKHGQLANGNLVLDLSLPPSWCCRAIARFLDPQDAIHDRDVRPGQVREGGVLSAAEQTRPGATELFTATTTNNVSFFFGPRAWANEMCRRMRCSSARR